MRALRPLPPLSLLLAALALSGCNTTYRKAMAQAKDAVARGDTVTAAQAFRNACRASPDDEEACGLFPVFAQRAAGEALMNTRPACEAGDLDVCLPPLLTAKDLAPEHPGLNEALERASQLHAQRCEQWNANGPLHEAVAGLACLQSRGHQFPVPGYQSHLSERAAALAARFADLASTARSQGTAGAASVLWSTAQCLAPDEGTGALAHHAREAFLAQSAIPVIPRINGAMPPRMADALASPCSQLAPGLPPVVRCIDGNPAPGQPEPLVLNVDAYIQRPRQSVAKDRRSVNYVSGTREVTNPEYQEARRRVRHAENEVDNLERELNKAKKDCEKAKDTHEASCVGCPKPGPKFACQDVERLDKALTRAHRERNDARQALHNTPEVVYEDLYDTFEYVVRTYRWTSDFRFSLQTSNPTISPETQTGTLRFEDVEHVGFGPAGVVADPLEIPPAQAYVDAFLRQLGPSVLAAIERDAVARAATRRAQCGEPPAEWNLSWIQCWAESSLWGNGREPQADEFLQTLASSAGAPAQPSCR